MNIAEFKQKVVAARTEMEVHRVVHEEWNELRGTHQDLWQGLQLAEDRALVLADVPPAERGEAVVKHFEE